MLSVSIDNIGKKFKKEWIFRNLSFHVKAGEKVLISGGNGSGKSTFLQVISGFMTPSEGDVNYLYNEKKPEPDELKDLISFASPYFQLIEDFTLAEMIEHAGMLKPFQNNIPNEQVSKLIGLGDTGNKFINQFSSGMKQRLKLGLAIMANAPLLLLDEPVSNLDKVGIEWYKQMMHDHASGKTVLVCSNSIDAESFLCERELNLMDFKS